MRSLCNKGSECSSGIECWFHLAVMVLACGGDDGLVHLYAPLSTSSDKVRPHPLMKFIIIFVKLYDFVTLGSSLFSKIAY